MKAAMNTIERHTIEELIVNDRVVGAEEHFGVSLANPNPYSKSFHL